MRDIGTIGRMYGVLALMSFDEHLIDAGHEGDCNTKSDEDDGKIVAASVAPSQIDGREDEQNRKVHLSDNNQQFAVQIDERQKFKHVTCGIQESDEKIGAPEAADACEASTTETVLFDEGRCTTTHASRLALVLGDAVTPILPEPTQAKHRPYHQGKSKRIQDLHGRQCVQQEFLTEACVQDVVDTRRHDEDGNQKPRIRSVLNAIPDASRVIIATRVTWMAARRGFLVANTVAIIVVMVLIGLLVMYH